jgi:hypothetical protein
MKPRIFKDVGTGVFAYQGDICRCQSPLAEQNSEGLLIVSRLYILRPRAYELDVIDRRGASRSLFAT